MKRVYIAGPYSADNIIACLDNMRKGMRAGVEVLRAEVERAKVLDIPVFYSWKELLCWSKGWR